MAGVAITIPEKIVYQFIKSILRHIKVDINDHINDKESSILHRMYNGTVLDKFDYYKEAVDLFNRDLDHPRRISVSLAYNHERAKCPQINIVPMSDQPGENELGVGESGRIEHNYVDEQLGEITPTHMRRFNSQYMIVCSSDSENECLLMYRTIQAMLISTMDAMELAGLRNVKFSGQELKMNYDVIPAGVFVRGIGIQAFHEVEVPRFFASGIIKDLVSQGVITA